VGKKGNALTKIMSLHLQRRFGLLPFEKIERRFLLEHQEQVEAGRCHT